LDSYGHGLEDKPEVVVLNKADAIPKAALAKKRASLEKVSGQKVVVMSGVSGEGVDEVLGALARKVEASRRKDRRKTETERSWVP
jgi:GTP-binding protein